MLCLSRLFQAGALNNAKDVFKKAGKKALIVSGKVMEEVGNVAKVTKILDELSIEYAIYTDITGEPTDVMIEGGLKVYKEENCDFLIGLGGGIVRGSLVLVGGDPGIGKSTLLLQVCRNLANTKNVLYISG